MVWSGCNRGDTIKTQKWPYLSQKWSNFHSVIRVLKQGMPSIIWEYSWGGSIGRAVLLKRIRYIA